MGAFSDIFGKVPKVKVLETFAENPNDALSAPEVSRATGVTKKAVYMIVRKYVSDGILTKENKDGVEVYRLNKNDLRAYTLIKIEPLMIIGKLEFGLKSDENILQSDMYPDSYLKSLFSPQIKRNLPIKPVEDFQQNLEYPFSGTYSSIPISPNLTPKQPIINEHQPPAAGS